MRMFTWSGYNWTTQERWGITHPDKPLWWYDESQVEVDSHNILHLKTAYNPFFHRGLNRTIPIGVGLVSCTEKFSHGVFEINARLPIGLNLWPAFWMWSWNSWPPEIDVFEGFSDADPYFQVPVRESWFTRFFKFKKSAEYNLAPNIHYRDGVRRSLHDKLIKPSYSQSTFKSVLNPTSTFLNYKLVWHPEYIRIYYHHQLVLSIAATDNPASAALLTGLNEHTMNVILNNGVTSFVNAEMPPNSDFAISSFKYTPLSSTALKINGL